MRVEVAKWGNSAAVRLPTSALKEAGIQIGQALELDVKKGRWVMVPAQESLESMLDKITPENMHSLALEGLPKGGEAW